ncbi:MAG: hypothetical protein LUQ25_00140 [Methanoregulaceae archaeon]|nr:hypothetical protein [Methanoregulaceae archaeon]
MEITATLLVKDRNDWRDWLREHHDKENEIWLVFYKKSTGKQTLTLAEAMEEAICSGWIDSIEKKIDDEKFALRFTPRRPGSGWSARNIEMAKRLLAEGRMTKAGFERLPDSLKSLYGKYLTLLSDE